MTFIRSAAWLLMTVILIGCSTKGSRAPVHETAEAQKREAAAAATQTQREKDWRPKQYIVQKGDTLYGIAFNYGLDYRELAELNGIQNPKVIAIGQVIRLQPSKTDAVAHPVSATDALIKQQPKLVKYPYSDAAMAQIEKVQEERVPVITAVVKSDSNSDAETDDTVDEGSDAALEWTLPTQGKVIGEFSETANRKGVDIAGKLGQPVLASASGKVVYSGSGLRGYGKLIIIKHNKTYLSAYAHNDKILVKEGQTVTRGQKIAAMGNTDASEVKLHFEVRRLGKPVNPAKFLSFNNS